MYEDGTPVIDVCTSEGLVYLLMRFIHLIINGLQVDFAITWLLLHLQSCTPIS